MAGGQAEGSSMRTLKPVGKKAGARMERKAWGAAGVGTADQPINRMASGAEKGERGF